MQNRSTKKPLLLHAIKIQDGYKRALAKNYITQHRFKDAITLLEESYAGISNKHATELLLFDCYLEVGAYPRAATVLKKNRKHQTSSITLLGFLNGVIIKVTYSPLPLGTWKKPWLSRILEIIWLYKSGLIHNIADYYGHQGDIKASYNHYIKTLALQPDHAYAKKGIAWILYSKEHNITQACVLIDHLLTNHNLPDYYLLKAEMASYQGDSVLKSQEYMQQFFTLANNPLYGDMYNTHKIKGLG